MGRSEEALVDVVDARFPVVKIFVEENVVAAVFSAESSSPGQIMGLIVLQPLRGIHVAEIGGYLPRNTWITKASIDDEPRNYEPQSSVEDDVQADNPFFLKTIVPR
ncbi:hypothetical protein TNCV_190561 [Trichonephila clavipes]|nr:hypothetical protein TNCV_190561 [Trichonephila clavipes]